MTLAILLICAASVFTLGINWGLPGRAVDAFLFGEHPVWTGAEIDRLAPPEDAIAGADVDANPIPNRNTPVWLNETDSQRAEIVRRYRLFSDQPDEMITFKSLARIRQFHGDPRLYQYGGLWIYPVGLLLKAAASIGLIDLRADRVHYLDHPEAFSHFYVVARLYCAAWGVLGAWAVFRIAWKLGGGSLVGATASSLCYIVMPVVVNMSHEAKPHLPGAVLPLLSILAAMRFVDTRATRWWLLSGALVGAAAGMILSAVVAVLVIPTMTKLAPLSWRRRLSIACAATLVAVVVYFATNPYVAIHLLGDRAVLRSNLSNSSAMYAVGNLRDGFTNAIRLMREGASLSLLIAGTISIVVVTARLKLKQALLLAAPGIIVLVQFIALAAGKPAEYGRFALLPDIVLAIAVGVAIGQFTTRNAQRVPIAALIVVLTAAPSWFYLVGFARDSSPVSTRMEDAAWIEQLRRAGGTTLAICAEPAPYSLPPANLFEWRIILMPRGTTVDDALPLADVIVRAVDALPADRSPRDGHVFASLTGPADRFPTRMSWAGKPFEIWAKSAVMREARRSAPPAGSTPR